MTDVPTNLQALNEQGLLLVEWAEARHEFNLQALRGQCQCAQCVNEWTGERILDPASVPQDIKIESMELVGSYAIRVRWSDGHNSGLFTWKRLQELAAGID
ncbi:DUF971 domain-containing protein [Adhaeretor mobilis]|uniref:DUF971 domain-containing protein n=1 Tax=Adhaeretor mobilis TaxID=1930276 RepID=UPI001C54DFEB|nr:DUF971 domain-containing protein [Adhaeretor mobilis]